MAVVTLNDGDILTGSIYSTNNQDQWQLLGHVTGSTTNQALTKVAEVTISGGNLSNDSRIKVTNWAEVAITNGSYWYGCWLSGAVGFVELNYPGNAGAGGIATGSRVVRAYHIDETHLMRSLYAPGSTTIKTSRFSDTNENDSPARTTNSVGQLSGLNVVQLWLATSGATWSLTYGAMDVEVLRN